MLLADVDKQGIPDLVKLLRRCDPLVTLCAVLVVTLQAGAVLLVQYLLELVLCITRATR